MTTQCEEREIVRYEYTIVRFVIVRSGSTSCQTKQTKRVRANEHEGQERRQTDRVAILVAVSFLSSCCPKKNK